MLFRAVAFGALLLSPSCWMGGVSGIPHSLRSLQLQSQSQADTSLSTAFPAPKDDKLWGEFYTRVSLQDELKNPDWVAEKPCVYQYSCKGPSDAGYTTIYAGLAKKNCRKRTQDHIKIFRSASIKSLYEVMIKNNLECEDEGDPLTHDWCIVKHCMGKDLLFEWYQLADATETEIEECENFLIKNGKKRVRVETTCNRVISTRASAKNPKTVADPKTPFRIQVYIDPKQMQDYKGK